MALTCPTDLSGVDVGFTSFIDCSTLNLNYNELGIVTITFSVISVVAQPETYTTLTFGGVTFTGHVTNLEVSRIPGTLVYEQRYTMVAIGC